MKKNIGTFDRVVRLVIGIILFVIAFVILIPVVLKVILILFGLFCLYEALTSWCAFYQLIGKNTCPIQ